MSIDDSKWGNLEESLALAVDGLLFTETGENVVSALSRLDGVLRAESALPEMARSRASELQKLLRARAGFDLGLAAPLAVGERHAWLAAMPADAKRELGAALTLFLRFVCHRGKPQ